jgi:hypothetical protein
MCKRETLVARHLGSSTLVLENHGYIAELDICLVMTFFILHIKIL